MLEFEHLTDTFANSTDFSEILDPETEALFKQWMLATPNLASSYTNQIIANMPSPRSSTYEKSNFKEI